MPGRTFLLSSEEIPPQADYSDPRRGSLRLRCEGALFSATVCELVPTHPFAF